MASQYSMYPHNLNVFDFTLINNFYGTSQTYVLSLETLNNLADYLGDGFYAENITLENSTPIVNHVVANNLDYNNRQNINAGVTMPVLRNDKWGDIFIAFIEQWNGNYRGLCAQILKDGEFISCGKLNLPINNNIASKTTNIRFINANSKLKMIYTLVKQPFSTNTQLNTVRAGSIVFKDDLIICHHGTYGNPNSNNTNYYSLDIIDKNGVIENIEVPNFSYEQDVMSLINFHYTNRNNQTIIFNDVFLVVKLIGDASSDGLYYYNGHLYAYPGNGYKYIFNSMLAISDHNS